MLTFATIARALLLNVLCALLITSHAFAQDVQSWMTLRLNEGTFAGLQALDLHSTVIAERNGAVEANPLMRTSLGNRIALKAAGTIAVIAFAEGYKRKHPRLVKWTLVGLNAGYAILVTRNYLVDRNGPPGGR